MQPETSPRQMSDDLRSLIFNLNPHDLGITKENFPHPVYAVVMETGYPEGSFTLVTIVDGTTSLYYSNGGGIIGGGAHEGVRQASGYMLMEAQTAYHRAQKVTTYPRPDIEMVVFYFLTFEGIYAYRALEGDLGHKRDALSDLFHASHRVISELRETEGREQR